MKKRLIAIVAFIMSVITAFSVSGCNLITTDKDRDNNQVVATVSISKDAPLEKILKDELTIAYMNYGYYYVYTGSYSNAEIYDVIINNLVNTRIMVQHIITEFDKDQNFATNDPYTKWELERYLTLDNTGVKGDDSFVLSEINKAEYETLVLINDLIDSYEEAEEASLKDTSTEPVRTTPTNAANDTEVADSEKADYIEKGIDKGEIGSKRLDAYNKLVKELEKAGLLGENFNGEDLKTSDYYKENLKIRYENLLIEKYQKGIQKQIRETVTFEDLKEKYAEMYNAQTGKFTSEEEFSSAVSSASAKSPVLYSPYSGYGYVYNLLLGVDEVQEAYISNLKGNTSEIRDERNKILASTVAVDKRGSWITAGYDYDEARNVFTGDYTLCPDSPLAYQGEVEILKAKTEDEAGEYRVEPKAYSLTEFVNMMDTYLFGEVKENDSDVNTNLNWYRKVKLPINSATNYDEKIAELLFAYSTDPGSLNTYKGYVITPNPSESGSETFVEEFAEAGRKLLEMGGNSYMIVATNYGYHVMFYSEALNVNVNYDTLVKYLNATYGTKTESEWEEEYNQILADWDNYEGEDNYLYILQDMYTSKLVDNAIKENESQVVNEYRYNNDYVVIYESRFADLKKA